MKNQITITLAQIKKCSYCDSFWSKVLKANGGDDADFNKRIPVSSILDSNNLDDTLWVLSGLPEYNVLCRKFAWWCAVQVVDYANDDRVSRCLEVVKRYNEGLATDEELAAAKRAAQVAAEAGPAWSAAEATAQPAARSAAAAAEAAAQPAARSAEAAAEAGAWVEEAAEAAEAAAVADGPAAWSAARSAQKIKLREILDSGTWRD